MQGSSGTLGEVVFRQSKLGGIVIARRPRPRTSITEKQEKVKDKFKDAVYYAKGILEDAALKAEYAARVNDKLPSVYSVAFTDYLKAPVVKGIDASRYKGAIGDKIEIRAVDDFKVVSVFVEVLGANGVLLESGEAVQSSNAMLWHYAATKANAALAGTKIIVTAKDKPGNATAENVVL